MTDPDLERARVPAAQLALLPLFTVDEVLIRHHAARSVAQQLAYRGLLSFDPDATNTLTPAEEAELDLLCAIVAVVGLRGVDGMLEGLAAPYAYRLADLVYDFTRGGWSLRAERDPARQAG